MMHPNNDQIAEMLEQIALLLEVQGGSTYKVRAYRNASQTVRQTAGSLANILSEEGTEGLERLPGIGKSISAIISEFLHTGRVLMLERLEGLVSPEDLFTMVPGIGERLAHRIHGELRIDTLEELELAAHDGRLEKVEGFGKRRVQGIRDALAGILSRSTRRRARRLRWLEMRDKKLPEYRPSVALVLAVDEQYRRKSEANELPTIAPRRFNPEKKSWLPVMHDETEGWSVTAMYSNTALAHKLGKTRNWVVIYYERDGQEDQSTVVTERSGNLAGKRVIRGRESECAEYYDISEQN